MRKKDISEWLAYYAGINFGLISVVTVYNYFSDIPYLNTGFIALLILGISFLLTLKILPVSEKQDENDTNRIQTENKSHKKNEITADQNRQLKEEIRQLEASKNQLVNSLETISREIEQIKSLFPLTAKVENIQYKLMPTEGTTYQLQQLILNNFKPTKSGLIGLEENIAYVYSLQLYKLVRNLNDASPDTKREILSDRCRELNSKMSFVKMVNYNLGTTYNSVSHYCMDGNPGNNDTVQVHSFKIENSNTGEILRKSVVSIGDIVL